MKFVALAASVSGVALFLFACGTDSPSIPDPASTSAAVSQNAPDCEDSAHMEADGCFDADGNPQDNACCKGGSNCEDEDGATCVKNAAACKAMGGEADGNDCNGSATGLSYC